MGNNRIIIIIFLSSKEIVAFLLQQREVFKIGEKFIKKNKLKPIKNLIRDNFNLILAFLISLLRVSPNNNVFSHVVSWQRQVYVQNRAETKLPSAFENTYTNKTCQIFITTNETVSFLC